MRDIRELKIILRELLAIKKKHLNRNDLRIFFLVSDIKLIFVFL